GPEGDHRAGGAGVDPPDGGGPQPGGPPPAEGRRGAAPPPPARHDGPGLSAGAALDLPGERVADAAEAGVAERVDLARGDREGPFDRHGALRHDDDRGEPPPLAVAVLDDPHDLVE